MFIHIFKSLKRDLVDVLFGRKKVKKYKKIQIVILYMFIITIFNCNFIFLLKKSIKIVIVIAF